MLKALLKGFFRTPLLASVEIAVLVTGPGLSCLCNEWMMQKDLFPIKDGVNTKTVGWIRFLFSNAYMHQECGHVRTLLL